MTAFGQSLWDCEEDGMLRSQQLAAYRLDTVKQEGDEMVVSFEIDKKREDLSRTISIDLFGKRVKLSRNPNIFKGLNEMRYFGIEKTEGLLSIGSFDW